MADEIVLSFQDSLLRQSDLRLLEEGRWLNDRLIGFMFEYVFFFLLFQKCTEANFCSISLVSNRSKVNLSFCNFQFTNDTGKRY